jgi:hypothetical protein
MALVAHDRQAIKEANRKMMEIEVTKFNNAWEPRIIIISAQAKSVVSSIS